MVGDFFIWLNVSEMYFSVVFVLFVDIVGMVIDCVG